MESRSRRQIAVGLCLQSASRHCSSLRQYFRPLEASRSVAAETRCALFVRSFPRLLLRKCPTCEHDAVAAAAVNGMSHKWREMVRVRDRDHNSQRSKTKLIVADGWSPLLLVFIPEGLSVVCVWPSRSNSVTMTYVLQGIPGTVCASSCRLNMDIEGTICRFCPHAIGMLLG